MGGDRAFALRSLMTRRSFSSGLRTFFCFLAGFALAFVALAFADFVRAFVDLAFVLGLDADFLDAAFLGADFGFAFDVVFFAAGLIVAAPFFTPLAGAVVLTVEDFFFGEVVVRPV